MKAPSPLLGFNNNVRHKGRVFHIQTEDSGIRHPHIITHLFADGGRILKTTKTSYAEHVGEPTLSESVRAMMKEQHKAMFIALRDGQLDHLVVDLPIAEKAPAPAPAPPPPPPEAIAAPIAPPIPEAVVEPIAEPAAASIAAAASANDGAHAPTQPPPPTPAPAVATDSAPVAAAATANGPAGERRTGSRPRLELNTAGIHRATSPLAPTVEMESIVDEPSIDLDLDALERAAVEAQTPLVTRHNDLPPPPAAMMGKKQATRPAGGYSVTATPNQGTPARPANPLPGGQLPAGAGRYAPSRPAAIFAAARPQDGASIFGEDLISEKSLDEVILSYLAEDLDGPGDKK